MTTLAYQLVSGALGSRAVYDSLVASGEAEHLPETLKLALAGLGKFYETDPKAEKAEGSIVAEQLATGMSNPKHKEAIREIFTRLESVSPSLANVAAVIRATQRERVGHELSVALVSGRAEDEVSGLVSQWADLAPRSEQDEELDWPGVLRKRVAHADRIPIPIRSLNAKLGGGLRPGHSVLIYANPESGKTALSLTLAVGMAKRGTKVLYLGNEDAGADLMVRAIQCLTKASAADIEANPEAVELRALGLGIANLSIRDIAPGSLPEIEKLVRAYRPQVLFVDQLRNLKVSKVENMTQRLDAAAQGIRSIAKRYKISTISITQAGDSARGKAILDMGDVDSSNVGIPGAVDVMIGIGLTDDLDRAGLRMLSLPKNKLTGDHGHFQVRLDPSISRVSSYD